MDKFHRQGVSVSRHRLLASLRVSPESKITEYLVMMPYDDTLIKSLCGPLTLARFTEALRSEILHRTISFARKPDSLATAARFDSLLNYQWIPLYRASIEKNRQPGKSLDIS
jgi:hypothetical protein